MLDPLTEVRFWQQVIQDSKRTVICSPEMESRCKAMAERLGLSHITVLASPACPDDKLMIIDEQAMKAAFAEALTKPMRLRNLG